MFALSLYRQVICRVGVLNVMFGAGTLQHHVDWQMVNIGVLPMLAIIFLSIFWLKTRLVRQSSCEAELIKEG